jgi:hypothetical protein
MSHRNNYAHGSIGWTPPAEVAPSPEIIGWGNELIGWGNELIGCDAVGAGDPEIIGCRMKIGHEDGIAGVGTDREWAEFSGRYAYGEDRIGFIPLIVAGVAAVAGAVSAGAATAAAVVGPIVAAVGGVQGVASLVGSGIAAAQGLIKAAEGGDKKAIAKLKGAKEKQAKRLREKAIKKLTEVILRARAGDLKAQAIIAGLELLKAPKTQKIGATAKLAATLKAMPVRTMVESAIAKRAGVDYFSGALAEAMKAAKKSPKWAKSPPKVQLPVRAMVKAGQEAGIRKLKTAAQKLPQASRGVLVLPNGQPIRGQFALVRS